MKFPILPILIISLILNVSCSLGKKILKENDYDFDKSISKMMVTQRTKSHLIVSGMGLSLTQQTALEIADLNARSKATRELSTLINSLRGQKTNNVVNSQGDESNISTSNEFESTITSEAKALLTNAETITSYVGKSNDGTGKKMAIITLKIPLKNTYSLITED